jgi:hypothetical protein
MTESALKEYLEGTLSVEEFRNDLSGTTEQTGYDVFSYRVDTIADGEFELGIEHVLQFCNDAINGNLNPSELDIISFALIGSDYFDWNSDRISETLFDWNNQTINYPITPTNLRLWKLLLESGDNQLQQHNIWNVHIEPQKELCRNHDAKWVPVNKKLNIGLGGDLNKEPIHGLRHPTERGTTGWFIWTGDYSEDSDFFKPFCAEHLLQMKPELIRFLGLEPGYRFLTDNSGHMDIWKDEQLLKI